MKQLKIVMTVHNRCAQTLSCLEQIRKQHIECVNITVFLTDDGCTDDTVIQIKKFYPEVHIISGNGMLFWNRGMLKAWKEAAKEYADFYLWLNDDVYLFDDAIQRLVKYAIDCDYNSIIVGSTLSDRNEKKLSYGGRCSDKKHSIIEPDNNDLKPCATFNGNIVLIPQKVFEKVGFNDEYYHHSFGDIDYGLSATKLGFTNWIAPGYYGYCKRNNPIPLFRRKCYSIIKRYKLLYSPLGFNPKEDFHFNMKHKNFFVSVFQFIKLHINVLFAVDHTKLAK